METVRFIFFTALGAIALMAVIFIPFWAPRLLPQETCEVCAARCAPYAVSMCSPGFSAICACDPRRPGAPTVEK